MGKETKIRMMIEETYPMTEDEYTDWLIELAAQFLERASKRIKGCNQTIEKLQIKIGKVEK